LISLKEIKLKLKGNIMDSFEPYIDTISDDKSIFKIIQEMGR